MVRIRNAVQPLGRKARGIVRIAVIHGPNLNLLGTRETDKYGTISLSAINDMLEEIATEHSIELVFFQSNSEGELVTFIQDTGAQCDGLVINPAAYTHTSVALRDALLAVAKPTIEVHLTNPNAREPFRHRSLIADIVLGRVAGFGPQSYCLGLLGLVRHVQEER